MIRTIYILSWESALERLRKSYSQRTESVPVTAMMDVTEKASACVAAGLAK